MKIRNWNEIVGKNGIRIEIEFFFRMEITLDVKPSEHRLVYMSVTFAIF